MKEQRFFYAPQAASLDVLPDEEAMHALKVLRMKQGDEICLMDGMGIFYRAQIVETTKKMCRYEILENMPQQKAWNAYLHIAMAPTKNIDRTEWFVEKAVEIGVDEITFLNTDFSERKKINLDRMRKIAVAAMKQSRKPFATIVNDLTDFKELINKKKQERLFICHCYKDEDTICQNKKIVLNHALENCNSILVAVGPEGDFSLKEVNEAIEHGFQPATLGNSRLRTETAALVATLIMNLNTMNHQL